MQMRSLIREYKHLLLLLLAFIISELIVNPIGNFPLNDDWSYGKSAKFLYETGKVDIGDFPAMTLWTHLVWGLFFTKIFGFSFTVLRFSTLVSALIGMLFLNKLIGNITQNKTTALMACLALYFSPLYFSLSNTYMTDVSFITFMIICCFFAHDFFTRKKPLSFLLVFIFSTLLVLIRQFGIIVPLCFTVCCLVFLKEKKWLYLVIAAVLNIGVFVTFKSYEEYLRGILEPGAAYKFSGDVSFTQRTFWDTTLAYFKFRYVAVLMNILIYVCPFLAIFGKSIFRDVKALTLILVSLLSVAAVYYVFKDTHFPTGNVFANTNLGAETFFQTLHPGYRDLHEHTYSETAESIAITVKYVFISYTVICCVLMLLRLIRQKRFPFFGNPMLLFLSGLFFSYAALLFIPESFTDRYHLPLIALAIICLAYANCYYQVHYRFAVLPLLFFIYISIAGTKDYLELNRIRWEAYDFLKNRMKIDHSRINGGFEVSCWYEGKKTVPYYFLDFRSYDYLIQYRKEEGFTVLREYEFQRYFPYKKDKIYIFANQQKLKQK